MIATLRAEIARLCIGQAGTGNSQAAGRSLP